MKTYLFQFTIGPVQSFIAQARKMQDLYAGSQILAELCHTAISTAESLGMEVVFPQKVVGVNSVPNRFIGKISIEESRLQEKGGKIETAVRARFKDIAETALKDSKVTQKPSGFDNQIDNHLEIYWLFYPVENSYKIAYENLEKYLGGLKNIRPFVQIAETGRKCSLDGERNALFFGDGSSKSFSEENSAVELDADAAWMNENEGLSAVSFVKRKYATRDKSGFESTAGIAMAFYIERNVDKSDYRDYKLLFNGGRQFDEQLCYEENITEKYFKKQGLKNVLKTTVGGVQKIEEHRKKIFGSKGLPKYYALLAFDGDHMGKIVGGNYLRPEAETNLEAFQKRVSVLLGEFAKAAQGLVNYPYGQTIYAGGDDFLGLITLDRLYTTLQSLRASFETEVNQKLKAEFSTSLKQDFNFSFSAGLAIAHYKMPLHFVLEKAREMEKKAKNAGRNRIAFAALKHSGEAHEAVIEWDLQRKHDKWESLGLTVMEEILKDLKKPDNDKPDNDKQANFSDTFVRNFEREMYVLQNEEGQLTNGGRNRLQLLTLAKAEIVRLIKRSLNPKLESKEKEEAKDRMVGNMNYLLKEEPNQSGDVIGVDIENFTEIMKIILFINRESTQS